jgi:hypothetical protein
MPPRDDIHTALLKQLQEALHLEGEINELRLLDLAVQKIKQLEGEAEKTRVRKERKAEHITASQRNLLRQLANGKKLERKGRNFMMKLDNGSELKFSAMTVQRLKSLGFVDGVKITEKGYRALGIRHADE